MGEKKKMSGVTGHCWWRIFLSFSFPFFSADHCVPSILVFFFFLFCFGNVGCCCLRRRPFCCWLLVENTTNRVYLCRSINEHNMQTNKAQNNRKVEKKTEQKKMLIESMGFPWSPALCRCPMSLSIDEDCVRLRSPCIWPRPWSALCQCHCDVPPSRPTVGALFPFISVFIIMSASNLICFRVLADLNGRVSLIHCIDMPNGKLEMFRCHRPDRYMNKWSATFAF